jgi:hypothetical protein
MPEPTIQVLGVYALPVTEELLQEQMNILYGEDLKGDDLRQAKRRCRKQFPSVVLVEALVRDADDRFDAGDFSQPLPGVARDNWQAAWAETYLSLDGESRLDDPSKVNGFRVAFFMHFWEPDKPLLSSYGELGCPAVSEMPERLRRLVPYEPLD